MALSVPPGRTREDLTASIARGEVFAAGVDTHIFPQGTGPQMINVDHMNERTRGELQRLVRSGTKVDGAIAVLLVINAEGKVVQTTPGTGDRALDQRFDRLWREAEFVPVSIGGCRVVTYFHIPMSFSSDFSYTRNETQMRVGPGAIPSEP